MKVTEKQIGEPARRVGDTPLAVRLVENHNCNLLGKSSWFALAALAGSLLRLFRRPPGRRKASHASVMHPSCIPDASLMHRSCIPHASIMHRSGIARGRPKRSRTGKEVRHG
jgi:hypothetical protein